MDDRAGTGEPMPIDRAAAACCTVLDRLETVVVGKRPALELVLSGLLAGGHVLLEDVPGLGKTLVARSLAQVLGLSVGRVQFTPDLMPADVTGSLLFDQRRRTFEFRPGPVFNNIVLGDEINRAPPKTQAALLEAMQERQVTVDGQSHPLPVPFIVLATQNPIELEGTYPLPEAQLDRFMVRTALGYATAAEEAEIIRRRLGRRTDTIELEPAIDRAMVLDLQATLEEVVVSDAVIEYCVALVRASRASALVHAGASPRGIDALVKLGRAKALIVGRDYVTPDDVKAVAQPALAHRIVLRPELWVRGTDGGDVVVDCLGSVPAPPAVPAVPAVPASAAGATGASSPPAPPSERSAGDRSAG
jgi:MoxR-like ATPase